MRQQGLYDPAFEHDSCGVAFVARLDAPRGLHRAVSVTGGEPLLHPAAVAALGVACRALGLRVHLETGGHRPRELAEVLDAIKRPDAPEKQSA